MQHYRYRIRDSLPLPALLSPARLWAEVSPRNYDTAENMQRREGAAKYLARLPLDALAAAGLFITAKMANDVHVAAGFVAGISSAASSLLASADYLRAVSALNMAHDKEYSQSCRLALYQQQQHNGGFTADPEQKS